MSASNPGQGILPEAPRETATRRDTHWAEKDLITMNRVTHQGMWPDTAQSTIDRPHSPLFFHTLFYHELND